MRINYETTYETSFVAQLDPNSPSLSLPLGNNVASLFPQWFSPSNGYRSDSLQLSCNTSNSVVGNWQRRNGAMLFPVALTIPNCRNHVELDFSLMQPLPKEVYVGLLTLYPLPHAETNPNLLFNGDFEKSENANSGIPSWTKAAGSNTNYSLTAAAEEVLQGYQSLVVNPGATVTQVVNAPLYAGSTYAVRFLSKDLSSSSSTQCWVEIRPVLETPHSQVTSEYKIWTAPNSEFTQHHVNIYLPPDSIPLAFDLRVRRYTSSDGACVFDDFEVFQVKKCFHPLTQLFVQSNFHTPFSALYSCRIRTKANRLCSILFQVAA